MRPGSRRMIDRARHGHTRRARNVGIIARQQGSPAFTQSFLATTSAFAVQVERFGCPMSEDNRNQDQCREYATL